MKIIIAKINNDATQINKIIFGILIKSKPNNQSDLFEPFTRNEQTQHTRQSFSPEQNSASYKNSFRSPTL